MNSARMFVPISPFRRALYARQRDRGVRRARAAAIARVSYRTARRLDDTERRCAMCGRPVPNQER